MFNPSEGYSDLPVIVPCGQCIGCRLERSRQWAIRCTHEASLYDENCFITLTYDNQHLPADNGLNKRHFQLFMKRLRKKYAEKIIRYYHCGEYGDAYGRPHYHALLFNHDFQDKTIWKISNDIPLYRSDVLSSLWPMGYSSIGACTFQSAAYVARYILKKITGDIADNHYTDPDTGVIKQSEYTTMSRRPGIAKQWLNKYKSDVFPCDNVVLNGKKLRPPKYYDNQYEISDPEAYRNLQHQRLRNAFKHVDNNTPLRLKTRERLQNLKAQRLIRGLDE